MDSAPTMTWSGLTATPLLPRPCGVISAFGTVSVPSRCMPSASLTRCRSGVTQMRASGVATAWKSWPLTLRSARGGDTEGSSVPSMARLPPPDVSEPARASGPSPLPVRLSCTCCSSMPASGTLAWPSLRAIWPCTRGRPTLPANSSVPSTEPLTDCSSGTKDCTKPRSGMLVRRWPLSGRASKSAPGAAVTSALIEPCSRRRSSRACRVSFWSSTLSVLGWISTGGALGA